MRLKSRFARSLQNAGVEGSIVVQKVREGKDDFGYNARTDEYENLFAAGVIDPTKVTRVALENAASIAGMLLTTECVLADIKEEKSSYAGRNARRNGSEWTTRKLCGVMLNLFQHPIIRC